MRLLAMLVLALCALVVVASVVLKVGAELSLDREFRHTEATAALPLVGEARSGLVRIPAGGHEFRARVAGLGGDGPAVLLLHGFPETSAMWTPLIDALAAAGYRVVAFDQRGYSPGARPSDVGDYALDTLAADVLAVADAVGFERFHLVGHDWGCVVGWTVVAREARVESWTAVSIPHPRATFASGDEIPAYIRFFVQPQLPEAVLAFGGLRMLHAAYAAETPDEQRAEYADVFSEPGALTGALAWYRALVASRSDPESVGPVDRPTLFLYGTREFYAAGDAPERTGALVTSPYESLALDADHWVIEQQPAATVAAILGHIDAHRAPASAGAAPEPVLQETP